MILFDEHICSDGLVQPPSSYDHLGTPMICVGFKGVKVHETWVTFFVFLLLKA